MIDFTERFTEISEWLSNIGADPTGGMTRLLYTQEWIDAQNALKQRFIDNGFEANFDEVGNLFGRVVGSKYPDETILSGSHIDTVVNGGNLDGQY
ncbi:MAG: Zn-dependent hydrolase, partial [Wohlfahrtiimonas sp.]